MKIDPISLTATCDADQPLEALEKRLRRDGYRLGYRPTDKKIRTLREVLEKRVPNLFFLRYGEIDDICVSLTVQWKGRTIVTKNVPRASTGPDFKKMFIGTGRRYGKMIGASLRIVPNPQSHETFRFVSKSARKRELFLKALSASGVRPLRIIYRLGVVTLELEGSKEILRIEKICLERLKKKSSSS